MCNILYKFISEVLVNRLQNILPDLISKHQSAFQSNKIISNNILVVFETLHPMKNQKSKKVRFMAMKLDMRKNYGKVEWNFLAKTIKKFSKKSLTF